MKLFTNTPYYTSMNSNYYILCLLFIMLSCQNKTTDNKHTSSTQAEIESEKIDNSNDNVSNQLSPNHDFENFKVRISADLPL